MPKQERYRNRWRVKYRLPEADRNSIQCFNTRTRANIFLTEVRNLDPKATVEDRYGKEVW